MLVGFDVRAKITSVQNAALLFCSSNKLCSLDDIFNLWLLYFGLFGLFNFFLFWFCHLAFLFNYIQL